MTCYLIIDTKVLVSALLSSNESAPPAQIIKLVFSGTVIPVFSESMLREYREVLLRPKFNFDPATVDLFIKAIGEIGILLQPKPSGVILEDMKDLPFYEVCLSCPHTPKYLITGKPSSFLPRSKNSSPR